MRTSFKPHDVTLLLKDVTGLVKPLETAAREAAIQSGTHYSEMLPVEHRPTDEYLSVYSAALARFAPLTATAAASVTEQIIADKGRSAVLISLARAGTPVGVLIKRFAKRAFDAELPHYSISIIRGRGIDTNAMKYILERHEARHLQFVDGWTGKGAIQSELERAMKDYPDVPCDLAVLSDPAFAAAKYGTRQDFLIPSSCLNSTVSGLISRTVYRPDIIGAADFHGAMYYREFKDDDRTYEFIDTVERHFDLSNTDHRKPPVGFAESRTVNTLAATPGGLPASDDAKVGGYAETQRIAADFGIKDINLVKPGIGETTRVLLRRLPWKILVHSLSDYEYLSQIYRLAKEKGVEILVYPLNCYKACGLIRTMTDL
ncbi:MAG: cysteine protease StiP family protein [Clostridiales Family XIII bacterium]|jgi:hypothetical protein|nr:cysteine protease StiP family protein [Clostridiales Family XIII bacterium]